MLCRHCTKRKATRSRGLCWTCFYSPARALYAADGPQKYARRGVADTYAPRPLPEPTAARPGTPQKLAVIEARAAARLALFHPADARA